MMFLDSQCWAQFSHLLDELLDLDAPSRESRLKVLEAGEPLLAQELRSTLAASRRADEDGFLCGNLLARLARPGLIGQRIGPYIIEAELGQGGTGSVWRARRADGQFEGSVAIKLLHLSLLGMPGAARFRQEGAILARLTHPNIARLLDAGVTPDGQPYLVLEHIDGLPIDQFCDSRQQTVEQRLGLMRQVMAGLTQAHSQLVVHRDIKPSNILVTHEGQVKLLDFGIAKILESQSGARGDAMTMDGHRAMTLRYAAPEQLKGFPVTTATDIYAVGVLIYEMLCGHSPCGACAEAAEVVRMTVEAEPARMSDAVMSDAQAAPGLARLRNTTLTRLRRQLKGDVHNIVAMAMRKDPATRYASMSAFAADVHRYLVGEPVSARPASVAYRASRFVKRNRAGVVAAVLAVAAVCTGIAGALTQAHQARHDRDDALKQLAYAQSSSEFITFLLEESSAKPFTVSELLDRAESVLEQQFVSDPAQKARLQLVLADLHGQAAFANKAQSLLASAKANAQRAADDELLASIDCQLGLHQASADAVDAARSLVDGALARLHGRDTSALAECLHAKAEVEIVGGDFASAAALASDALTRLRSRPGSQHTLRLVSMQALANARGKGGDWAGAARDYESVIAELAALGRGNSRTAMSLQNNLGVLLSRAGQPLAAAQAYEKAMSVVRGSEATLPALEGNYAHQLAELGRTSEAIALLEHVLQLAEQRHDARAGPFVMSVGARAWCLAGDLQRCEHMVSYAASRLPQLLPPGHPTFGTLNITAAELWLARGDATAARQLLERAIEMRSASQDKSRSNVKALSLLARSEVMLGDLDAAERHAEQAVAQAQASLGGFEHSNWLGLALMARGTVAQARGKQDMANVAVRAALEEFNATLGPNAPSALEARRLLGNTDLRGQR